MRRYFGSCKVRGEGNSVIVINREILPGPEDARICFTFSNKKTRNFNENEISILLIMIICKILLFILIFVLFLGIKIHQGKYRSFRGKKTNCFFTIYICKKIKQKQSTALTCFKECGVDI